MIQAIVSLLMLIGLGAVCPPDARANLSDRTNKRLDVANFALLIEAELTRFLPPALYPARLYPAFILAQMTRDEHERLRLELRRGGNGLNSGSALETLLSPSTRSKLSWQERRFLRQQLRDQLEAEVLREANGAANGSANGPASRSANRTTSDPKQGATADRQGGSARAVTNGSDAMTTNPPEISSSGVVPSPRMDDQAAATPVTVGPVVPGAPLAPGLGSPGKLGGAAESAEKARQIRLQGAN